MIKGILGYILLIYLFYHSPWAGIILAPILFFYYRNWKQECIHRKEQEFRIQFGEALKTLVTALNIGYSVENAIRAVPKEIKPLFGKDAVIIREFSYMIRQLDMNVTAEKAFQDFAERVNSEELLNFVMVFSILKRSGGDMIHVLRGTIDKIHVGIEVKQEIETLIAAKKMEFKVMTIIPLGIIVYMKVSFPEFMSVLYKNTGGIVVMTGCLLLYMGAWYIGKRMLEIEV